MNWLFVDSTTYQLRYGIRKDAEGNITGPFDCTSHNRRVTLHGWEGWCAVEEGPGIWAVYFDVDDNALGGKVPSGTRILEIEVERREERWKKADHGPKPKEQSQETGGFKTGQSDESAEAAPQRETTPPPATVLPVEPQPVVQVQPPVEAQPPPATQPQGTPQTPASSLHQAATEPSPITIPSEVELPTTNAPSPEISAHSAVMLPSVATSSPVGNLHATAASPSGLKSPPIQKSDPTKKPLPKNPIPPKIPSPKTPPLKTTPPKTAPQKIIPMKTSSPPIKAPLARITARGESTPPKVTPLAARSALTERSSLTRSKTLAEKSTPTAVLHPRANPPPTAPLPAIPMQTRAPSLRKKKRFSFDSPRPAEHEVTRAAKEPPASPPRRDTPISSHAEQRQVPIRTRSKAEAHSTSDAAPTTLTQPKSQLSLGPPKTPTQPGPARKKKSYMFDEEELGRMEEFKAFTDILRPGSLYLDLSYGDNTRSGTSSSGSATRRAIRRVSRASTGIFNALKPNTETKLQKKVSGRVKKVAKSLGSRRKTI